MNRMKVFPAQILFAALLVILCSLPGAEPGSAKKSVLRAMPPEVQQASESYKERGDVFSLLLLFQHLKPGLTRSEVDEMLGKPDYSPTKGQYYYFARDAVCLQDVEGPNADCGVVIEYRKYPDETVRNTLQSCTFSFIGE